MILLDSAICQDLEEALSREWLETNGMGGFACSSIAGANTRRYHGLLTAATRPPLGRMVLLSKLEEVLIAGETRIELSVNEYFGAIHPQGFHHLQSFSLDPWPVYVYEAEGTRLQKSVFMVHGSNTSVIEYKVLSAPAGAGLKLELRPLIAFRDYHSTTHENSAIRKDFEERCGLLRLRPYDGVPDLYLAHNADRIQAEGYWYRNFLYRKERERGLDNREDLLNPLAMYFHLSETGSAVVIASTDEVAVCDAARLQEQERRRRIQLSAKLPVLNDFTRELAHAADQFLVSRSAGETVIAGYPWFTDWGRDTMIALPGLTLFTGRAEIARGILLEFARHVDRGMLPNRFPEGSEQPEFNSVDAALWFFEAVRAYVAYSGDIDVVKESLYLVLVDMIEWHRKGTRYGIRVMEDGLLNAGAPGVQLTWMDAKIGDWVVTPRSGKPVEIQALWYNALRIIEEFSRQFGDRERQQTYGAMASKARSTFNRVFWNNEAGRLYDVVDVSVDGSMRPNQIFAVSLRYSMLGSERARAVVDAVEKELLTAIGLRTLSPHDARYVPHYEGPPQQRDAAYHQGTIWPWLLGPFVSAYVRVHGDAPSVRKRAFELLAPMEKHLHEAGVGQISEIFDADPPFTPRGCFAQAWSVAEVLRALMEDVYQVAPCKARDLGTCASG